MTRWFAFTGVFVLVVAAFAAGPGDSGFTATKVSTVVFAPAVPVKVAPGGSANLDLDFRVNPGFHINSSHPNDTLLLPTVLKVDAPTDIMIAGVKYPPGKDLSFDFLPGEKLNVYTGDFRISALVKPLHSVTPGTYRVHAVLKYQACDNRQCYPPREVPADFDVKVQKPLVKAHKQNPGQSPHIHQ